ncbi:MAG: Energy-coupling factor transporter transmembrane protein EcfT [Candidatus Marinimicrobia bacterium]|nr:Energy-coupling factor transporter transmembrane protein EcfT [Candidatus Neomarinimicrobiota bacterium]
MNADNPTELSNRWHPFSLILAGLFLAVTLAISRDPLFIAEVVIFSVIFLRVIGATVKKVFRAVRFFLWMLPFTFTMHLFLTPSGWRFLKNLLDGSVQITLLGPATGFTLQIFGFIYIMGALAQLTTADRIITSLHGLQNPLRKMRIPVDNFFQILNIGLRFFPLLRQEASKLQEVRRGLGIEKTDSLTERVKLQMYSIIPLFVGTLHRAETVAQMMTLRGFIPGKPRSSYLKVPWHHRDTILVGIVAALGAGLTLI